MAPAVVSAQACDPPTATFKKGPGGGVVARPSPQQTISCVSSSTPHVRFPVALTSMNPTLLTWLEPPSAASAATSAAGPVSAAASSVAGASIIVLASGNDIPTGMLQSAFRSRVASSPAASGEEPPPASDAAAAPA